MHKYTETITIIPLASGKSLDPQSAKAYRTSLGFAVQGGPIHGVGSTIIDADKRTYIVSASYPNDFEVRYDV